ncbi:MAG: hypothetical protein C0603_13120 [Denitrovibrio sp.]|nr:MAG: hypothetical protein C0603_13120 [Denitrovibrio sp.]
MRKFILLLVLMIPAIAFARFEKLTTDINDMFSRFTGYVVSVENNDLITDLGRNKGVYDGMQLKIYRLNEPIIHPITKQVLGNKKIFIGDIEITEVFDTYSNAKISKLTRSIKPGDLVTMNPPVDVAVKIEKLPVRLELLLKEEISRARNIIIKDNASITLTFTQKEEGGIGYSATDSKNGNVIYSRYFSDQDLGQGVGSMATKDILRSKQYVKSYKSMAVGHAKPDGKIYIAAAAMKDIDLYVFNGKDFAPAGSVNKKFENIQNIELADLDGDGTDELFVSELKYETTVRSSIYEFDGKEFKELDSDMQYIFRTVHVKGKKKIVAQKLAVDGSYIGMVHNLLNNNGKYERGSAVSGTREASIYGFGYSDLNGNGMNEVLSIDKDYHLSVYNGNALKYTSVEQFGQTPNFFMLKNEVADETSAYKEGESDPFVYEMKKKYIKGRVFVNSDNNIYLVQNDPKYQIFSNTKIYGASRFAVYSWDGRRLRSMWQSETFEPTIEDYYMYEEFGRTYLFLLRTSSEGILGDDLSQFIYIETK